VVSLAHSSNAFVLTQFTVNAQTFCTGTTGVPTAILASEVCLCADAR